MERCRPDGPHDNEAGVAMTLRPPTGDTIWRVAWTLRLGYDAWQVDYDDPEEAKAHVRELAADPNVGEVVAWPLLVEAMEEAG